MRSEHEEPHVLEDLELVGVSLVPAEDVEGFGGGVVSMAPKDNERGSE